MRSPSFYIPDYRKFWEAVSVNGDVEVIILGEDLEVLVQMRAYGSRGTIS